MRFVGYQDRKAVAAALQADLHRRERQGRPGRARWPSPGRTWGKKLPPRGARPGRTAWERFTPFLAFPPELRRVIYTTNAIESLNYQLRKVTKNRGHFPNDEAVIKLLWLAICNIEDKRARQREKERGLPGSERKAAGRLVEGQVITNWKAGPGPTRPRLPRPHQPRWWASNSRRRWWFDSTSAFTSISGRRHRPQDDILEQARAVVTDDPEAWKPPVQRRRCDALSEPEDRTRSAARHLRTSARSHLNHRALARDGAVRGGLHDLGVLAEDAAGVLRRSSAPSRPCASPTRPRR